MRIEILDEAEKDLVDGYAFYERQSQGLGHYFLDSRRDPAWIRNRLV